ncbi:hypothetical protein LT40_16180 [Pseudomonas rhizosphaerae]|uniref:Uncharacterized protein n=1 Tax=Pseudomonas rhizosphaerae TaxID=216142 RepID=A0A089YZB7_9PSED|nr:hypothetical protein LT40_16180 [Pseudomonas rhizosphaerae]
MTLITHTVAIGMIEDLFNHCGGGDGEIPFSHASTFRLIQNPWIRIVSYPDYRLSKYIEIFGWNFNGGRQLR